MAQSWDSACKAGDAAAMTTIRTQAGQMLPVPSLGEDILGQMKNCAAPPVQVGRSTTPVQTAAVAPDRTAPARLQPAPHNYSSGKLNTGTNKPRPECNANDFI